MKHSGKNYRFEIDDFFELYPYLENDSEFRGNCPVTGNKDGLILIESPLQIKLPYIKKTFQGKGYSKVIKPFLEFVGIESNGIAGLTRRWFPRDNLDSKKAEQINDRCEKLSKMATEQTHSILLNNKKISRKYNSCTDIETKIIFLLSEGHRLYHPDSDNILTWSDYYQNLNHDTDIWIDFSVDDWNDTGYYKHFKHCYLFHDLFDHKMVNLQDLMQVDVVNFEFKLRFDHNYDFL